MISQVCSLFGLFVCLLALGLASTPCLADAPAFSNLMPANGAEFSIGTIGIYPSAHVSDPNGTLDAAQIACSVTPDTAGTPTPTVGGTWHYANNYLGGYDFGCFWVPTKPDGYTITFTAPGAAAATVHVTVTNAKPVISNVAPTANTHVWTGGFVYPTAHVSDPDWNVDTTSIACTATGPNGAVAVQGAMTSGDQYTGFTYSGYFPVATVGDYTFRLNARDQQNVAADEVATTITADNPAPTVTITAPLPAWTLWTLINNPICAQVSDPNYGTIQQVKYAVVPQGNPAPPDPNVNAAAYTAMAPAPYGPGYTADWIPPAAGAFTIYVVAQDNEGKWSLPQDATVTVTATNPAPVVTITEPTPNAIWATQLQYLLRATANDWNGAITPGTVKWRRAPANEAPIQPADNIAAFQAMTFDPATWTYTATMPPFTATGDYTLYVVAQDNEDTWTMTSVPVTVTNPAPYVHISQPMPTPPGSQYYTSHAPLTIRASADDWNGGVDPNAVTCTVVGDDAVVYRDAVLMAAVNGEYTLDWTPPHKGTYTVTVTASDTDNPPATGSDTVTFYVGNGAPSVWITTPLSNTTVPANQDVVVTGGSWDNGTVTSIELRKADGTPLGAAVPPNGDGTWTFTWPAAQVITGVYTLTAYAKDDENDWGMSSSITLIVDLPAHVTFTPNPVYVAEGGTAPVTPMVDPPGAVITYVSLDPGIATIAADGTTVTGVATGTATIEARAGGFTVGTLSVTVVSATLTPATLVLPAYGSGTLTATVTPAWAPVSVEAVDPMVVSVMPMLPTVSVSGMTPGATQVRVTLDTTVLATTDVTVVGVTFTPNPVYVAEGGTATVMPTVQPAGQAVTYVSLNPAIATISADGTTVTGVLAGSTTMEARVGTVVVGSLSVTVVSATLTPATLVVPYMGAGTLTATVTPAGMPVSVEAVDPMVVSVMPMLPTVSVYGMTPGETTVRVTLGTTVLATSTVTVVGVTFMPNPVYVAQGGTTIVTPSVQPVGQAITYVSLDPAVATISVDGTTVTGIAAGTTTIEARVGTVVVGSLSVTVVSATLTPATLVVPYMGSGTLTATVTPAGAPVMISATDPMVASVMPMLPTVSVYGMMPGTTQIRATLDTTVLASTDVTVVSVTFTPNPVHVAQGGTVTITPTVLPAGQAITYASLDTTIATISADGTTVTGMAAGTTTIEARVGTVVVGSLSVTVVSATLTPATLVVPYMGSGTLTATVTPAGAPVMISATDPMVASVMPMLPTVSVYGMMPGTTQVQVTLDTAVLATTDVTVVGVTFTPNPVYVAEGGTTTVTPTVQPAGQAITYVSLDPLIATISVDGSTVTGVAAGTTTIEARVGAVVVGTLSVTVVSATLTPATLVIPYMGSGTLTATITPTWAPVMISATDPMVASVMPMPPTVSVFGMMPGTTQVQAKLDTTVLATADITVVAVTFTPNPVYVAQGSTATVTPTVQPVGQAVTYTSQDPTIATVSADGSTITGILAGTTTIEAKVGEVVVGTLSVTVVSASLTPATLVVPYMGTGTLTATITPTWAPVMITAVDPMVVSVIPMVPTVSLYGMTPGTTQVQAKLDTTVLATTDVTVVGVTFTPNPVYIAKGATVAVTPTVQPAGQAVTYVALDPAIATISADGTTVTGVAAGTTTIEARVGEVVVGSLSVTVVSATLAPATLVVPYMGSGMLTATVTPDWAPVSVDATDPAVASVMPMLPTVTIYGMLPGTTQVQAKLDTTVLATTEVTVVGVTFMPNPVYVAQGCTATMTPTVEPAGQAVTYVSLDPAIATVSADGTTITGVLAGTTTVEARVGEVVVGSLSVTVVSTTLAPETLIVPYMGVGTLTATVSPTGAPVMIEAVDPIIVSVMPMVPTVSVYGMTPGATQVQAKLDTTVLATAEVTVVSVTFTPNSVYVAKGSTATVTPTVLPAEQAITYVSLDPTIATISADGTTVTGVAAGSTTIEAKVGDVVVGSLPVIVISITIEANTNIAAGGIEDWDHQSYITAKVEPAEFAADVMMTIDGTPDYVFISPFMSGLDVDTTTGFVWGALTSGDLANTTVPVLVTCHGLTQTVNVTIGEPSYSMTADVTEFDADGSSFAILTESVTYGGYGLYGHQIYWEITQIVDSTDNIVIYDPYRVDAEGNPDPIDLTGQAPYNTRDYGFYFPLNYETSNGESVMLYVAGTDPAEITVHAYDMNVFVW
jgi:uncharacterized protein YjdB